MRSGFSRLKWRILFLGFVVMLPQGLCVLLSSSSEPNVFVDTAQKRQLDHFTGTLELRRRNTSISRIKSNGHNIRETRCKRGIRDGRVFAEYRTSSVRRIKHTPILHKNELCQVGGGIKTCSNGYYIQEFNGIDTRVVFVVERPGDIEDYQLDGPDGKVNMKSKINEHFRRLDYPEQKAILFMFRKQEPGTYNWTIISKDGAKKQDVHVAVSTTQFADAMSYFYCYVNVITDFEDPIRNIPRYAIYANFHTIFPVINCYILAYCFTTDHEVVLVYLHDDGNDPDKFEHDGYYSGYLTNFTIPGKYQIGIKASVQYRTNNLTILHNTSYKIAKENVPIDPKKARPLTLSHISRYAMCGSFVIPEFIIEREKKDPYPPNRVTDLQVVKAIHHKLNIEVHLQWTATGEKLDQGNATSYHIRFVGKGNASLEEDFEAGYEIKLSHAKPKKASSVEKRKIDLPLTNDYAIMVVGMKVCTGENEKIKCSKTSNLVYVYGKSFMKNVVYYEQKEDYTLGNFTSDDYKAISYSEVAIHVLLNNPEIEFALPPEVSTLPPEKDPEYVFLVSLSGILVCIMLIAITCFCCSMLYNYFRSTEPQFHSEILL